MRVSTLRLILTAYAILVAVCLAFAARAVYGGADIPVRYGGYFRPTVVHQPCLLTYYANRSLGCDRISQGGFE